MKCGVFDAELALFSYRGTGKCAKYGLSRVGEILSESEIAETRKTIEAMRKKPAPESIAGLKGMFLEYFSGITLCHLSALNSLDLGRLMRLGERIKKDKRRQYADSEGDCGDDRALLRVGGRDSRQEEHSPGGEARAAKAV